MNPVDRDAAEFGVHVRAGGWRLGLLVARNVEKGAGNGRPRRETVATETVSRKVSAQAFAKRAGTSADRVLRYLEAWERAADAGIVPPAAEIVPDQEAGLPDDDARPWSEFYSSGQTTVGTIRQNRKAVERAIAEDAEFAETVADALSAHRPAAVARQASKPDVARAIARNDDAREAVEEEAIEHRSRFHPELPDPDDVARRVDRGIGRKLEVDVATSHLRGAAGELAEAIVTRDLFGIEYPEAQAEALDRVRRYLAMYESGEPSWSDDDRGFLSELGVDLEVRP